jgi:hypothetical protein
VVVIAGSARGGERFQLRKLDTLGSITVLAKQSVPILFIHGTRDSNVAVEIPLYMFQVLNPFNSCFVTGNLPLPPS